MINKKSQVNSKIWNYPKPLKERFFPNPYSHHRPTYFQIIDRQKLKDGVVESYVDHTKDMCSRDVATAFREWKKLL